MSHYLVNGGRQFKINESCQSTKALQQHFPGRDYRLLAKLAGSDWQRGNAVDHSVAVGCLELCESTANARDAYDHVAGISRRQAYRALSVFPYHIPVGATKQREGALPRGNSLYMGTSLFLLNREYEMGLAKELKASPWRDSEPYANLSELRYIMIRSLAEELGPVEHRIFQATPGAIWLFCEGAICLRQLQTTETSDRKDYQATKGYIDTLGKVITDKAHLTRRPLENAQDGFRNADLYIDGLAADLASENPDFDRLRFRPYMAAHRRWNGAKRKLGLLNPARPGPKLGTKRKANC